MAASRREQDGRRQRIERLGERLAGDLALAAIAERLSQALAQVRAAIEGGVVEGLQHELTQDSATGEQTAGELRACAQEEAEIQTELRGASEVVTEAEVAAQRLRDQAAEAQESLDGIVERLGHLAAGPSQGPAHGAASIQSAESSGEMVEVSAGVVAVPAPEEPAEALSEEEAQALQARVQRLARRREQLGPVNPLAQEEYTQALEHVEELEARRADLETALRELRAVIRDTDRQIRETFEQTFEAAASNFQELAGRPVSRWLGPAEAGQRGARPESGARRTAAARRIAARSRRSRSRRAPSPTTTTTRRRATRRSCWGSRSRSRQPARRQSACRCSPAVRSR